MESGNWNPRKPDVERFTEGDCHIFARALHKLTGWPIHTFGRRDHPYGGDVHAFCVLPDGRIADIEGVRDAKDFCADWHYSFKVSAHHPRPWSDIRHWWGGPAFGPYSYRRARIVAERLLESYGL